MPDNATTLTDLLLRERSPLLRRLQNILGNRPAAEDVAQSLWFRVQSVADDPPISQPRAFLYRLASNLAIDHLRNRQAESGIFAEEVADTNTASDQPSPEQVLLGADALERMKLAFSELSPRCRQVVQMRRMEGKGVAEIASALGISRQMVWRYMNEAMDHLSDRMADVM